MPLSSWSIKYYLLYTRLNRNNHQFKRRICFSVLNCFFYMRLHRKTPHLVNDCLKDLTFSTDDHSWWERKTGRVLKFVQMVRRIAFIFRGSYDTTELAVCIQDLCNVTEFWVLDYLDFFFKSKESSHLIS